MRRAVLVICLLLAACARAGSVENKPDSGKTYQVSPTFREFYIMLGGLDVLGPAISETFTFQNYECQYTVNALMCLNPAVSGVNRFGLYPLGISFSIGEDPENAEPGDVSRVVNGYTIYEEFVSFYDQLSGSQYVGGPITKVHINYTQQRVEQYFENLGFYRLFSDAPGTVKLLAYGALACDEICNYTPQVDALVANLEEPYLEEPFLPELGSIGGSTDFGEPLTQSYLANDGAQEQIYTNVVVFSPSGKPDKLSLRPISILVGQYSTDPGPKQYTNEQGVVFYPVKDGLGFHVPIVFDDFISAHGGLKFSGNPIAEIIEIETGRFRQCFDNYCLDYQPANPAGAQVSMAPLGMLYLEQIQPGGQNDQPFVVSVDSVDLQVTEQYKKIPNNNPQRIQILLVRREDGQGLAGISLELDLILPDGSHYSVEIEATQEDGTAEVTLPVMKDLQNGSILPYKVCLKTAALEPVCAESSFLIWNSP